MDCVALLLPFVGNQAPRHGANNWFCAGIAMESRFRFNPPFLDLSLLASSGCPTCLGAQPINEDPAPDGARDQLGIVADPAKARYWNISWLARTLHCCAACCVQRTAWTPPRKRIGQSSGSPTSAGSPKRTLRGLSKKPSAFRRIAIC